MITANRTVKATKLTFKYVHLLSTPSLPLSITAATLRPCKALTWSAISDTRGEITKFAKSTLPGLYAPLRNTWYSNFRALSCLSFETEKEDVSTLQRNCFLDRHFILTIFGELFFYASANIWYHAFISPPRVAWGSVGEASTLARTPFLQTSELEDQHTEHAL